MNKRINELAISAAKYYMGAPDGKFFSVEEFGIDVATAKNAYVTINTLMGNETAELARYFEKEKQVAGLITKEGLTRLILLYILLARLAVKVSNIKEEFECIRVCSKSEIELGESFAKALTSTTKLSVEEIMAMKYGKESELAICRYRIHPGAVVLDMEKLGIHYLKPDEREVLIIIGNKLVSRFCGYDMHYLGKTGKPATLYEIDVYSPSTPVIKVSEQSVLDEERIKAIRKIYEQLNNSNTFPRIPEDYWRWKTEFQNLVYAKLLSNYKQL